MVENLIQVAQFSIFPFGQQGSLRLLQKLNIVGVPRNSKGKFLDILMSFARNRSQAAAAYSRWGLIKATYSLSSVLQEEYS